MHCDLICLSHLRWDGVPQRPQHLMSRAARSRQVLFVEEQIPTDSTTPSLFLRFTSSGVVVVVPHVPQAMDPAVVAGIHSELLRSVAEDLGFRNYVLWSCGAPSRSIAARLEPTAQVCDLSDEGLGSAKAEPERQAQETAELRQADLVFAGGERLLRAKRHLNPNMYCLPSAVDLEHFGGGA